ncbi:MULTISPECIES: glycosyltransferase N-terminal domain-containing protein [unclassified Pseudodesulfovibrio]|uniref:3-deoxy-D-manno-octulosonic acid transferase n=1 Tax=unclassified Pseudodesulfovibrio TaxID=2661612 RepID=UPI000FEBD926|nr:MULTISPECIES: glycosyltransferase N-terminal domain-containing protein [unclassified Pseudodesulfovibrio]MCJ2163017.1 3-deoxy-D-manno-octulosonic acid transferase [Pseudodesulfovibrio sp. S3-i]RWU07013.1 3-deoxy-D-manno-octulosonic acid transferase [Pseudodesulfovibrio sp. S3]
MGKTAVDMALAAYGLGWKGILPLLKLNPRLKEGWNQRTLSEGLPAPAHLWIQAASGGEAYLAWEVLKRLESPFPESLRVLVTTNTLQGYQTLIRAAEDINGQKAGLAVQPWYFPFDAPKMMQKLVSRVQPKLALILETEIWPGFLRACKRHDVPVLLANGRMTTKSLAGYLTWPGLFRALAPDRIMAVSETDGQRFGTLFGRDRVWTMPNIKFDRMGDAGPVARKDNPLRELIGPKEDFVILGSVRRQEHSEVARLAAGLMSKRPGTILGLFPRHMHHLEIWRKSMDAVGLKWTLRSQLKGQAAPGTVILWDSFGELVPAYGLAKAAFVGGSLAPLGGQNFLEPLTCGVTPVTGPHWKNFNWVGREIIDSGLAIEAADWQDALKSLDKILTDTPSRKAVAAKANQYIRDRRGGTEAVCKQVADFLNKD